MIGSDESLWRVLGVERIVTREYLVTLKARHALGTLPELNPVAAPEIGREKAVETFDKLADSAYREMPESVIENARHVAQWCLNTWLATRLDDPKVLTNDLGETIKKIDQQSDKPEVILSAARIINRFHPRTKPNEQHRRSTRPIMEADAEFSLAAIGVLLREFGWAH